MSFLEGLLLLLVGLKLAGYIDWSWWLVVSPVFIPAFIAIAAISYKVTKEVRGRR